MSIDSSYSSFILDNEEFFLIPGSRFSAQELRTRLKEMNINVYNTQDREYLKQLYDSAIQDYNNRVKILHRLRRDTEITNLRLNQSERQPMPYNLGISGNLPQKKVMNISYDINNQNIRQKQIKKGNPLNNDDMEYANNPSNSNMGGYNEYDVNRYGYDNNINLKNINRGNNYDYNKNIQNNQYNMNNYLNKNEYNKYPFYNNYPNNNNQNEKINLDINDNNNKVNQQYPYNEKIKREIMDKNKYNFNFKKKSNNNIHIIPESKDENDSDEYDNNNSNNYVNQPNYQKINIIPEKIQSKNKRKDTPYKSKNIEDNIHINLQKRQMINNIEQNNENSFINALYEGIEVNNNMHNNKDQDNNNDGNVNENINNKNENIKSKRDDDDKSFFSFFSVFENAKKSPLYKYRKFILIHLIVLIAFLLISIVFLHFIYNYRESIMNFISDIFKVLTDPRRILDLVTSFISALLLGPIHYWYISIPLLVSGFVLFILMRKYLFNKRCKEIIEKIVQYLQNGENDNISEEDIYKKFVQIYGITFNKFLKKYLPKLNKMRRSDNRLKQSSMKINEKVYVFWELTK